MGRVSISKVSYRKRIPYVMNVKMKLLGQTQSLHEHGQICLFCNAGQTSFLIIVSSMWFWSVSWQTNCPVYFSLFLVDPKKICSVSGNFSPVHVVLVILLVHQLSGLFLIFFGRPKKKLSSLREFLVSLWEFLVDQISFWYTKIFFGQLNFFLVDQKFPETDQKFPETGQFFLWSTKKK